MGETGRGALPLRPSRLFPQRFNRMVCRDSPRRASDFLGARKSPKNIACIPRPQNDETVLCVPCAAHSIWGFSDSASLHSLKRRRHPCLAPSQRYGLLTQTALRCSARQTAGKSKARFAQNRKQERKMNLSFPRKREPSGFELGFELRNDTGSPLSRG